MFMALPASLRRLHVHWWWFEEGKPLEETKKMKQKCKLFPFAVFFLFT
jgi:hypothetical protein